MEVIFERGCYKTVQVVIFLDIRDYTNSSFYSIACHALFRANVYPTCIIKCYGGEGALFVVHVIQNYDRQRISICLFHFV